MWVINYNKVFLKSQFCNFLNDFGSLLCLMCSLPWQIIVVELLKKTFYYEYSVNIGEDNKNKVDKITIIFLSYNKIFQMQKGIVFYIHLITMIVKLSLFNSSTEFSSINSQAKVSLNRFYWIKAFWLRFSLFVMHFRWTF